MILVVMLAVGLGVHWHTLQTRRMHTVRCAVIGGMTMTGMWQEVSKMFEAETGYHVVVVVTGERPLLDQAIRAGKVDLLTMHSGDITTDVVADGIGPTNDPAGIRGMTNGPAALRKIAEAKANFVDFQGIGSREVTHTLWRLAGVEPKGDWFIRDDTAISKWNVLQFCRSNHAYVVVGYIPALTGKMANEGMEILVKNDPVMRRPYIVMEANPKKFPEANYEGAKALEAFLLSTKVQDFLREFGRDTTANHPLFYPVNAANL
jgi:tungstate transport system substrate-binding protein